MIPADTNHLLKLIPLSSAPVLFTGIVSYLLTPGPAGLRPSAGPDSLSSAPLPVQEEA